jgi:hypothetical protein
LSSGGSSTATGVTTTSTIFGVCMAFPYPAVSQLAARRSYI